MSAQLLGDDVVLDSLQTVKPEDQVEVNLDDLIVGRPLSFPIYDAAGMLLLAEGSRITSEFRKLLRQRGMTSVQMHTQDADKSRLKLDMSFSIADAGIFALDSELTNQLDRVIDSGLLQLQNRGPAAREQVTSHGRQAYNKVRHQRLQQQRQTTCDSLSLMLKDAVHGKALDGTAVTSIAGQYLSEMFDDTDCVLSTATEASQDADLSQHSLKMATLGMAIGIEMGLDEDNCKRTCVAGLIHDWGMVKINAEVRNSTRLLTEYEFFQIKKHPIFTAEMLERMSGIPSMVPVIVYQVHERPNGLGYPRGRTGERIHPLARILAVADMYAALTTARPYRAPLAPYAAMECLIKQAKTRDVDPDVVRALLKVLTLFPIGSFVAISDGSVAQVLRRNGNDYSRPIVRIVQDHLGNPTARDTEPIIVDLAHSELLVTQALPTPGRNEQLLTQEILQPVRRRA